eukprot:19720-Chlamydomonas_euryale.AAC.3
MGRDGGKRRMQESGAGRERKTLREVRGRISDEKGKVRGEWQSRDWDASCGLVLHGGTTVFQDEYVCSVKRSSKGKVWGMV